jgi:hypothetical protein
MLVPIVNSIYVVGRQYSFISYVLKDLAQISDSLSDLTTKSAVHLQGEMDEPFADKIQPHCRREVFVIR